MEKLKELVNDFYEYTKTISISEMELFENYYCKLSDNGKISNETIEKMIKQDILYDFIFNQEGISTQLENDTFSYDTDSLEYKEIENMYKKIQKVFPDFKIKRIEEVNYGKKVSIFSVLS